jgi:hypothetical protein
LETIPGNSAPSPIVFVNPTFILLTPWVFVCIEVLIATHLWPSWQYKGWMGRLEIDSVYHVWLLQHPLGEVL